jgi:hypothetical protein
MDRQSDLLFGALAIRLNHATAEQVEAAARVAETDLNAGLVEALADEAGLSRRDCELLWDWVKVALDTHGGDAAAALAAYAQELPPSVLASLHLDNSDGPAVVEAVQREAGTAVYESKGDNSVKSVAVERADSLEVPREAPEKIGDAESRGFKHGFLHRFGRKRALFIAALGLPTAAAIVLLSAGLLFAHGEAAKAREKSASYESAFGRLQDLAQASLYDCAVIQAGHYLRENMVNRAQAVLETTPHHSRNWEWHYLHQLAMGQSGKPRTFDSVALAAFQASGGRLYLVQPDGQTVVWDLATAAKVATWQGVQGATALAVSTNSNMLATAGPDGVIHLLDGNSATSIRDLEGHQERVRTIFLDAEARRAVSCDDAGKVILWDLEEGVATTEIDLENTHSSVISPDGAYVATVTSRDGMPSLSLWRPDSEDVQVWTWGAFPGGIMGPTAPFENNMALGFGAQIGMRFRPMNMLDMWPGRAESILVTRFVSEGLLIATAMSDETIEISSVRLEWNTHKRLQPPSEWRLQRAAKSSMQGRIPTAASLNTDGKRLLVGHTDGVVGIMDTLTGTSLLELEGPSLPVTAVTFEPMGLYILALYEDGQALLWETSRFNGLSGLRFGPRGRWFPPARPTGTW